MCFFFFAYLRPKFNIVFFERLWNLKNFETRYILVEIIPVTSEKKCWKKRLDHNFAKIHEIFTQDLKF